MSGPKPKFFIQSTQICTTTPFSQNRTMTSYKIDHSRLQNRQIISPPVFHRYSKSNLYVLQMQKASHRWRTKSPLWERLLVSSILYIWDTSVPHILVSVRPRHPYFLNVQKLVPFFNPGGKVVDWPSLTNWRACRNHWWLLLVEFAIILSDDTPSPLVEGISAGRNLLDEPSSWF